MRLPARPTSLEDGEGNTWKKQLSFGSDGNARDLFGFPGERRTRPRVNPTSICAARNIIRKDWVSS